jgi:2-polyprenyl-3-methyl-5-hydroxy-6-metoxy-1,4-benzoquinol methylase
MTDGSSPGLFTFSQKANYWNGLYDSPSSLFEHNMRLRRDYAKDFICGHFAPSARVMDLGCGGGVLSEKLIESGFTITAVDASQDMLHLTRERLKAFPAGTHKLIHSNCLSLPFPDGEFDLVVCLGMFGYFDQVTQALGEIRRVLRPGGTLILSVRNAHTHRVFDFLQLLKVPVRGLRSLVRRLTGPTRHVSAPTNAAVAVEADDGFRIHIYQAPSPLIDGVSNRGYSLVQFDGFGYGPVTLAGRKLFSEAFSVTLSDFLNRAFHALGLNTVSRWFADVSFYIFQRRD